MTHRVCVKEHPDGNLKSTTLLYPQRRGGAFRRMTFSLGMRKSRPSENLTSGQSRLQLKKMCRLHSTQTDRAQNARCMSVAKATYSIFITKYTQKSDLKKKTFVGNSLTNISKASHISRKQEKHID